MHATSISSGALGARLQPQPRLLQARRHAAPALRRSRVVAAAAEGGASSIKWTYATVVENRAVSADASMRVVTLGIEDKWVELDLARQPGGRASLREEAPRWHSGFKIPGQVIALRLGPGDVDVSAMPRRKQLKQHLIVPIASTPYQTRRDSAFLDASLVEILVDNSADLVLTADGQSHKLSELKPGTQVQVSEPEGRGFASLFDEKQGLLSAIEEKRNLILMGTGVRGIGAIRCVVEWQPVAAHAGVKTVSLFLEAPSAVAAPFVQDYDRWREAGIRVHPCYSADGVAAGRSSRLEEELFRNGRSMGEVCGGDPSEAAVLLCGFEGETRSRITKELTASGFDAERILLADFLA